MLPQRITAFAVVLLACVLPAATAHAATHPNDPLVAQQWHLAADNAAQGWAVKSSSSRLTVAVIDTGVDMTHPDLKGNLWTNKGEIPGNGIDDDHDGYVDDVHGYDFVDDDGDPTDLHGHGTHVAGILAARGNNHVGGTGIAQRAKVMALRVLDATNSGTTANLARAIRFAADHGAKVANVSINTETEDPAVDSAISYANTRGMLIVVSAGNDATDLGQHPSYPACSTSPNVLTVAATDKTGQLAPFSNYGSCVDVAAPGTDILSTAMGGGYELRSGTSMASPQIAGAALLAAARDRHATIAQLTAALTSPGHKARAASAGALPTLDLNATLRTI